MRQMWKEERDDRKTIAAPRDSDRARSLAYDPARAAWIRIMGEKEGLGEERAASLWDADIPMIPRPAFSEGFHSRDTELEEHIRQAEEKTRQFEEIAGDLRKREEHVVALRADLASRDERILKLQSEMEKMRMLFKAVAVLSSSAAEEEIATDSDRMTQIAFSVLTDVSLAVSGQQERSYPSQPVYIRAAAVFKKLYDQGESSEFLSLYQDLSSLLREMEPYMFAVQQAGLEKQLDEDSDEEEKES